MVRKWCRVCECNIIHNVKHTPANLEDMCLDCYMNWSWKIIRSLNNNWKFHKSFPKSIASPTFSEGEFGEAK